MNRYPFPGALPRARKFENPDTDSIGVPIAVLEARLRASAKAAGNDYDADAGPSAPPRPEALARARSTVGHQAQCLVRERQEFVRRPRPEPRPKSRRATYGTYGGSWRRLGERPKREKCFGIGRPVPLDREAKVRIATRARALMHPTVKGRAYGKITAKMLEVLKTLLWVFHNTKSGWCFPSYEAIAKAAHCNRDTVAEAVKALEACGLLTWCNRLKRVVEDGIRRVRRSSNSYRFNDPRCKSDSPTRTQQPNAKTGREEEERTALDAPKLHQEAKVKQASGSPMGE